MVTSCTAPPLSVICALTTPCVPSCKARLGTSGGVCVGHKLPIVFGIGGGGAGGGGAGGAGGAAGAGGGGGAMTCGVGGGVATD